MTEKVYLHRGRPNPTAENPTVNRSGRKSPVSEQLPFLILDQSSKSFPKFNVTGLISLTKFNSRVKTKPWYISEVIHYNIEKLPSG